MGTFLSPSGITDGDQETDDETNRGIGRKERNHGIVSGDVVVWEWEEVGEVDKKQARPTSRLLVYACKRCQDVKLFLLDKSEKTCYTVCTSEKTGAHKVSVFFFRESAQYGRSLGKFPHCTLKTKTKTKNKQSMFPYSRLFRGKT